MGIKYADLDKYLTDGTGEEEIIARIEALHKRSAHKRQMPPMGPVVRG
jgi:NH3-dependent NAD+ synthetase